MNKAAKIAAIAAAGTLGAAAALTAEGMYYFGISVGRENKGKMANLSGFDEEKLKKYAQINDEAREWLAQKEMSDAEVKSIDGLSLVGSVLLAKKPSDKFVILYHGYRGSGLKNMALFSRFYHESGYNVVIPDARAHGKSEGKYIGYAILDRYDCLRWVEYLQGRWGKNVRIVLHGVSMGAASVLMASELFGDDDNVKAVVADSAFSDTWAALEHSLRKDYHKRPFPLMNIVDMICQMRAGYSLRDGSVSGALVHSCIPVFFVHGTDDTLVPVDMAYENYEACAAEKDVFLAEGAGHVAAYYEYKDEYEKRLAAFLKEHID